MSNTEEKTKNDMAWNKIFTDLNINSAIESSGLFVIEASTINKYREARLMTKFDHKVNLPDIFRSNGLSILPITRGSYVISDFVAFHGFEEFSGSIEKVQKPDFIESIDFQDITSEATALNAAFVSGIIADFTGESEVFPTVSGRMGSKKFSFNIDKIDLLRQFKVEVSNSQIEIDGGYEGVNSLTLIEAKNTISDDFLVRQLYYPLRLWSSKISKQIKTVFLTYSNGVFTLYEYAFSDINNYNSLVLVKSKRYSFTEEDITLEEILEKSKVIKVKAEPEHIPFPQANSFERIVNLCEIIHDKGAISKEDITLNYDFNSRQTNYYTRAGMYLDLIQRERSTENGVEYRLTDKGNSIFKKTIKNRNLSFVEIILEKAVFNETVKLYLNKLELPNYEEVVEIMKVHKTSDMNETTMQRRASTVLGWVDWLISLTE